MAGIIRRLSPGPGLHARAMFLDQLARMSKAGMSPVHALKSIAKSGPGFRVAELSTAMARSIEAGAGYADAMRSLPDVFSQVQANVVAAAERAGDVEAAFSMLAKQLERRHRRRQKLLTGLLYPILLVHLAVMLPPVVHFVTKGTGAYLGEVLPALGVLYGCAGGAFVAWKVLSGPLRKIIDPVLLVLPLVGGTIRRLALARFCRACGCLYEAGVPVGDGVRDAAEAAGNTLLRRRLLGAAKRIIDGATVSEALRRARVFKFDALAMLETGESSGTLEAAFNNIAEQYDFEAELRIGRVVKLLPVFALLAVSLYIGYIYISTILKSWAPLLEIR